MTEIEPSIAVPGPYDSGGNAATPMGWTPPPLNGIQVPDWKC
jgi:hypothetical protein